MRETCKDKRVNDHAPHQRRIRMSLQMPSLVTLETTDADENGTMNVSTTAARARRSSIAMTKYEHAKIIGIRAEQLARGAQPFVNEEGDESLRERFDPIAIAHRELAAGVLPFIVIRKLPDGSHEKWRLRDFIIPN